MANTIKTTLKTFFNTGDQPTEAQFVNLIDSMIGFSNQGATVAPGVSDDSGSGYQPGSMWTDTTNDKVWVCVDASVGAAVWIDITASASGEANTASNIGTGGVGMFKQKAALDLEFKKLNAGSTKITITDDTGNDEVDVDFGSVALADLSDVAAKSGTGTTVIMQASPSITTPTIASFVNSAHDHEDAAGGGVLDAAAISTGTIVNARLDSDLTAIADLATAEGFYRKTGAGAVTVHKSNLVATVAPGSTDDSAAGYSVGSLWIDVTGDKSYFCVDATATSAVWNDLSAGGGAGLPVTDTTSIVEDGADTTKEMRIDVGAVATATVRVLTMPDQDIDLTPATGTFPAASAVFLHDGSVALTGDVDIGSVARVFGRGSEKILELDDAVSAVNWLAIASAATGADPKLIANGADTNVGLDFQTKGSGVIQVDGVEIVTLSATQTLTSKTLTTPTVGSFTNATHDHQTAAGGGVLDAAAVTTGTFANARLDSDLEAIGDLSTAEGFYRKTAAGAVTVHKSNLAATVAPGSTDDSAAGYSVGSLWIDTTADKSYRCVDSTASSAVWNDLTAGGGAGLPVTDTTSIVEDGADTTKEMRIDVGAVATSTVRVLTMPNQDIDLTPGTGSFATEAEGNLATTALQDLVDDGTPQLGGQLDVNGQAIGDGTLELLKFTETGSAINEFTIVNAATGNAPQLQATGDDTNISLNLVAKGTGVVQIGGVEAVTLSATQTLTSKTLTTPTIGSFTNATHDHSDAAGGGTLDGAVIATGTVANARLDSDLTAIGDLATAEGFYRKTAAGAVTVHKSNLAASAAPGATDDSAAGYSVGSVWIDTTNDKSYFCVDSTASSAVWNDLTGGGGSLPVVDTTSIVEDGADPTKEMRIDVGAVATSTVRVLTMPNQDIDLTPGTGSFATEAEGNLAATALQNVVEDTSPALGGHLDINGQVFGDGTDELLTFVETGSAVNQLTITNAATGNPPILSATGGDTNIGLNLVPKGTGVVQAGGVEVVTLSATQTLTSKTLTTPTIGSFTNATHDHQDAAGGGVLDTAAITTGTFATARIAAPHRTLTKIVYIESPTATDSFPIGYIPDAATMVRAVGVTDVGTVDFNIEKRSKLTPDVAGTNIWTVDKQATAAGLDQTSFDSGAIGADSWLNFNASAVASSPTKLWVALEFTID